MGGWGRASSGSEQGNLGSSYEQKSEISGFIK
jgi:hypothetical protein